MAQQDPACAGLLCGICACLDFVEECRRRGVRFLSRDLPREHCRYLSLPRLFTVVQELHSGLGVHMYTH